MSKSTRVPLCPKCGGLVVKGTAFYQTAYICRAPQCRSFGDWTTRRSVRNPFNLKRGMALTPELTRVKTLILTAKDSRYVCC